MKNASAPYSCGRLPLLRSAILSDARDSPPCLHEPDVVHQRSKTVELVSHASDVSIWEVKHSA